MGLVVARETSLSLIFTYRESWLRRYSIITSPGLDKSIDASVQGRPTGRTHSTPGNSRSDRKEFQLDGQCLPQACMADCASWWTEGATSGSVRTSSSRLGRGMVRTGSADPFLTRASPSRSYSGCQCPSSAHLRCMEVVM